MLGYRQFGSAARAVSIAGNPAADGALRCLNNDQRPKTAKELEKLAEESKITAETTHDPNRKQALRVLALKYMRLAKFVRSKRRSAD